MRFFALRLAPCLNSGMQSSSQQGAGREPPLPERDIVSVTPGGRPISDEVRASLAAVRVAQEAAKLRRRRDAMRVRALTATALVTVVAGVFVLEHLQKHRRAAFAAAGRLAPSGEPGGSPPSAAAPLSAPATPLGETPLEAASASLSSSADDALATCTEALAHHRLRAAAGACADAFQAQPSDARLAMKVAQVQHARGQHQSAGDWARRAIVLQTTDPDAFLIVAHAETRARRPVAASSAYRQYLAMAPRGLHASEARQALRAAKRKGQAGADPSEAN
jgi:hypothetical protein